MQTVYINVNLYLCTMNPIQQIIENDQIFELHQLQRLDDNCPY